MDRREKGRLGEDAVCAELIGRGHVIVERNFRRCCGEIDIISRCGGFIVFTEVKAREYGSMVSGLEAVDVKKRSRMIRTADSYLAESKCVLQPRYDIAVVTLTTGDDPRIAAINIFEDAFTADGIYTVY